MFKRKGFTLAELIVAIVVLSMIFIIIASIFNVVIHGRVLIGKEADLQADLRTTTVNISNATRKATAVFVVTDEKYDGTTEKLTPGWSYIGLSADGKSLLNFRWNKTTKTWDMERLSIATYDVKYGLKFSQTGAYEDNKVLNFELTGSYGDGSSALMSDSSVMALNAKQIFDQSKVDRPGVAIAYRDDPIENDVNASVSFVFDVSSSMNWKIGGTSPSRETFRMAALKKEAAKLVDSLNEVGGIRVNLVIFGTRASFDQREFLDLKTNKDAVKSAVANMSAYGATNPGDGLRHSLVSLQSEKTALKHVILLTDGVPNTVTTLNQRNFAYDLSEDTVGVRLPLDGRYYSKNDRRPEIAVEYAKQVAQRYSKGVKRISVIGFSGRPQDKTLGGRLTAALNVPANGTSAVYYDADSQEQLAKIFDDIKLQIAEDLWFVVGP